MSDLLLQIIVEKLEAMELLLKYVKPGKDEEGLKRIQEEIQKISSGMLNTDKINNLKVSIDACYKKLEQPFQNRVEHKHHFHKGIWITIGLLFASVFFFRARINAIDSKKQTEANDLKYRALKVTADKGLLMLLYHTDSLYNLDAEHMRQWVVQEEERLIQDAKMLQLAGEKKKEAKDLRKRAMPK